MHLSVDIGGTRAALTDITRTRGCPSGGDGKLEMEELLISVAGLRAVTGVVDTSSRSEQRQKPREQSQPFYMSYCQYSHSYV